MSKFQLINICVENLQKMVLKLAIEDEKRKRKALKVVAVVEGVDSVAVDMKQKTMTVIGEADPLFIASRLREFGFNFVELQSVGPAKERNKEKKEENKSENPTTVYVPRVYYDYSLENALQSYLLNSPYKYPKGSTLLFH
ncbi:heavy metal-associated isoprenylated plant protein 39-like isoform X2 [Cryptomeria japonica]|uniref:heavy metal-associated isoprenylated plant protein 39-like isoform X2 n=1 Tax=Cryptomeria japonica TaxID=3369 RepID=UPI0027DA3F36|nr:heavy metal-associated isoprenylated plant protein 39-like isoform X2 [Cryptomeria japonica]